MRVAQLRKLAQWWRPIEQGSCAFTNGDPPDSRCRDRPPLEHTEVVARTLHKEIARASRPYDRRDFQRKTGDFSNEATEEEAEDSLGHPRGHRHRQHRRR